MAYEIGLSPLNWHTVLSLVLMVLCTLVISFWAVYELRGGGLSRDDELHPSERASTSIRRSTSSVPDDNHPADQSETANPQSWMSGLSTVLQSRPKLSPLIHAVELQSRPSTFYRPFLPRPINSISPPLPRPSVTQQRRISTVNKSSDPQTRAITVPGLPHPRFNPIRPKPRVMYRGPPGKSRDRPGYDEERDSTLLGSVGEEFMDA